MTDVEVEIARGNTLLNALDDADLTAMLLSASVVELPLGAILYRPGERVAAVHFPLSGVVSLVTDLGDEVVEAATVGLEGMSGVSVFLGAGVPTERAVVQVGGRAVTLRADEFTHSAAVVDGPLYKVMRGYTQVLFTQLARNAGCNRVHLVQQRAARWLLTTADRMDSPSFTLTQHFLAQMLAVRRTSVSEVAQFLAEDGCLTYTRGTITITDRPRLHAHACDCYDTVREATDTALAVG